MRYVILLLAAVSLCGCRSRGMEVSYPWFDNFDTSETLLLQRGAEANPCGPSAPQVDPRLRYDSRPTLPDQGNVLERGESVNDATQKELDKLREQIRKLERATPDEPPPPTGQRVRPVRPDPRARPGQVGHVIPAACASPCVPRACVPNPLCLFGIG